MNSKRLERAGKLGIRFLDRTHYYANAPEGRHVRGKNFRRAMKWFRVVNKGVSQWMRSAVNIR